MLRRKFIKFIPVTVAASSVLHSYAKAPVVNLLHAENNSNMRSYWVYILTKIARPVLFNLSEEKLKIAMPCEAKSTNRAAVTHLEAFGRLMAGIAPWLELGAGTDEEGLIRKEYILLCHKSIANAVNPASPDYMDFTKVHGAQPLVDAAFLAHGLLRGYTQLWLPLSKEVKINVINALKLTHAIKPGNNNWVLFSAMIEAFFIKAGELPEMEKISNAINLLEQWYKGDGTYGDGPQFHCDYYNSFVMHPMLIDIVKVLKDAGLQTETVYQTILTRAKRYAAIQERMISPEGTFPPVGRSLAYRFGAFQLLAQITLMNELPKEIEPAQVREALSAVIKKSIEALGTFDSNGWLQIGFCGHQPGIGEDYISTGSLYLCTVGLLPLGLTNDNEFWAGAPKDWTAKKAWSGINLPADHAINV